MSQSGSWRVRDDKNDSTRNSNEETNYKRSKSFKNQRNSNSGSPRTNSTRDLRNRESSNNEETIRYVWEQTGKYYTNVEISNSLKHNSVSETIKQLNDRRKTSYSQKVSGNSIVEEMEENTKEKNKKTNGVSKNKSTQGGNTQTTNKETTHTSQTGQKETTHTQQTSHKDTTHTQQTGHSTTPPREDNEIAPTLDDFKVFERTLTEKQIQLTKQTDMLNKILEEYSNIKESKTKKIEELKNEKKVLEIQKQKFLEEINNINKHLKDLDDQINTSEKDLVQQLKSLQKKAEPFQTRLHH